MMPIIAFLMILIAIVSYKLGKTAVQEKPVAIAPRERRVAAQHAADMSMREHVVIFHGGLFQVMPSDQQYKARGDVVFVAVPNYADIGVVGEYRDVLRAKV